MRLTQVLLKQHIGFAFKRNWIFQSKKRPHDTKCEEHLTAKGFEVLEANQYIHQIEEKEKEKLFNYNIPIVAFYDKPVPRNKNHPEYKEKECLLMKNDNVLLQGLPQAQIVTKTHVVGTDRLPDKLENAAQEKHPREIHEQVKTILMYSNIFDTEQNKLPKIKDPERPAYNFTRLLGITDCRRNVLMTTKLMNLLEKTNSINQHFNVKRDVECITTFQKDEDLYQLQFNVNAFLISDKPLSPFDTNYRETTLDETLPTLHPINHRISFPREHFYKTEDVYPIKEKASKWYYPHTSFLHHNNTRLANLHGSPVTEDQIWGRSLLHCFTLASSYAKSVYGDNVKLLPEPVTTQCIQSDGCNFYFGVFQLNNLELNGVDGVKNLWHQLPVLKIFNECKYENGRPYLSGYNPTVYNYMSAMYRNT